MSFLGTTYTASQMVFLRHSEHTYGSTQSHSDLELQIVHRGTDGTRLVIVISYANSTSNSLFMEELDFSQIRGIQPGDARPFQNAIDAGLIFTEITQFITYTGSLSRPPCTPNYQYLVITSIKRITSSNLSAFPINLVGMVRHTQDRENREITIYNLSTELNTNMSSSSISSQEEQSQIEYSQNTGNTTVQGFQLNGDRSIVISANSSYPIVAPINSNLPFPGMNHSMLNVPINTQSHLDNAVEIVNNIHEDEEIQQEEYLIETGQVVPQETEEEDAPPPSRQDEADEEFAAMVDEQEAIANEQEGLVVDEGWASYVSENSI